MLEIRIILLKNKFIMLLVSILTLIAAVLCPHINNNIHQSPAVSSLTSYVVAALGLSSSSKTLNILTPKLPQGTNRILDRRYFSKKDWNGYSDPKSGKDDSNSIFNKERRLKRYENYDIVNCLDSLFVKRNRSFYITFIGDSLMRNQFKNFLEVIPGYDRITSLNQTNLETITRYHEDNNVTSKILNDVLVSFRWHTLINDKLISDLKYWADLDDHQTPDIIFIGPTVHHMLEGLYNFNVSFLEIVEQELLPVLLSILNNHPRKQIFWKMQSPTADILRSISTHPYNNLIHVKKIHDYNKILERIFRGTGIEVWDSLLPVVEEYMRSCALQRFLRSDDTGRWWCGEFLHYGRLVSSIGSQQIFNHLCNN